MQIKPGKWKTKNGNVVSVRLNTGPHLPSMKWAVERNGSTYYVSDDGRASCYYGVDYFNLDCPIEEAAPVREFTHGTPVFHVLEPSRKLIVVGRRTAGGLWVEYCDNGECEHANTENLEPWAEPKKTRTWTHFVYQIENIGECMVVARTTRDEAEKDRRRVSDVVEVRLTEKLA